MSFPRTALLGLTVALLAGCWPPRPAPPPPVHRLALFPPSNLTDDPLLVSGTSMLERYALHAERTTVADILGMALHDELERRGIVIEDADALAAAVRARTPASADAAAQIAHHARVDDPVLFVAIDRWEPDNPSHPAFVIVAVDATLVDPITGNVEWHFHRDARPVATPATVTSGTAHEVAARRIAAELLESWPVTSPARP